MAFLSNKVHLQNHLNYASSKCIICSMSSLILMRTMSRLLRILVWKLDGVWPSFVSYHMQAIDKLPLIPNVFEFVGILFTGVSLFSCFLVICHCHCANSYVFLVNCFSLELAYTGIGHCLLLVCSGSFIDICYLSPIGMPWLCFGCHEYPSYCL